MPISNFHHCTHRFCGFVKCDPIYAFRHELGRLQLLSLTDNDLVFCTLDLHNIKRLFMRDAQPASLSYCVAMDAGMVTLKDAALKQSGRAEDLYLRPADLFVAGFFSELNVYDTRAAGGLASTPAGKVEAGGFEDGTPLSVAIRTSGLDVSEVAGETEARILSRRYLGVVELLELAVSGAETPVRARVRCGALSPSARDIWLSLRKSDVLVFERATKNA